MGGITLRVVKLEAKVLKRNEKTIPSWREKGISEELAAKYHLGEYRDEKVYQTALMHAFIEKEKGDYSL